MKTNLIGLALVAFLAGCGGTSEQASDDGEEVVGTQRQALTCGAINQGENLYKGQLLWNCERTAYLYHQPDGNVVLYSAAGAVLWSTNTWNQPSSQLAMQTNGEAALFTAGYGRLWHTQVAYPARVYWSLDFSGCGIKVWDAFANVTLWVGRPKTC